MKRTYHYSVRTVYSEDFTVEAETKEEADVIAQERFNDPDDRIWDALAGDPDTNELTYEGFERDGEMCRATASQRRCLTKHPKEERSWE